MKIIIIVLLVFLLYNTLICSTIEDVTSEQPAIQKEITATESNLQILDKLHSLYYDVMIFFGILVAFIGILLPLFINFYQTKKLKIEKENLKQELLVEIKSEIKNEFDLYEEKFKEKIEKMEIGFKEKIEKMEIGFKEKIEKMEIGFKEKIEKMEIGFEKKSDAMSGMVFHVQGRFELNKRYYAQSLVSYIYASSFYLEGEDYGNFQRVTKTICESCFPMLFSSDFDIVNDLEKRVNNFIKLLTKYNNKARYTNLINALEKELLKAKKRERPTQT
jgi:hypothetical protein